MSTTPPRSGVPTDRRGALPLMSRGRGAMNRRTAALLATLLTLLLATGCVNALALPTSTAATPHPDTTPATGTAEAALALLPVKGRAPLTGYSRTRFGQAWADVDHNGCDTRNDILARDLTSTTRKPGTRDCVVLAGLLHDPYTGRDIPFVRGPSSSSTVQIDHVVALGDAWQTGAQQLDPTGRERFANDPLELLAVDGPINQAKGDGDAATWLPPNTAYRCAYVARQVAVKTRYALWVTSSEHEAMVRILRGCPDQLLPSR